MCDYTRQTDFLSVESTLISDTDQFCWFGSAICLSDFTARQAPVCVCVLVLCLHPRTPMQHVDADTRRDRGQTPTPRR